MNDFDDHFADILWRLYRRPDPPSPWTDDGNLPWDDPQFSERMLREHLDQSHGAASRVDKERALQIVWLAEKLELSPADHVLDVTCGPGLYAVDLAGLGCQVTGLDFSPASIAYARELAAAHGVTGNCRFRQVDVRAAEYLPHTYDAALLLYGQLGPFRREHAAHLLQQIATALKPGAKLAIELLDQERVDKKDSTWWFTDDKGLWGDRPFLHLGQRNWLDEDKISVEQFVTIDLQTAEATEINLCDQTYAVEELVALLEDVGFDQVEVYEHWDGLPLYDAAEWVVYIARK